MKKLVILSVIAASLSGCVYSGTVSTEPVYVAPAPVYVAPVVVPGYIYRPVPWYYRGPYRR